MTEGLIQRAAMLVDLGRYPQALAMLGQAPGELMQTPAFWTLQAIALMGLEDHSRAADACAKGIEIDPEDATLWRILSRAREEEDDLAAGERAVLNAIRLDPADPLSFAAYARLAALGGQGDKARRLLAHAQSLAPDDVAVLEAKMLTEFLSGSDRAAKEATHALLRADPESQAGHAMRGMLHLQLGEARHSAAAMRTAVLIDPSNQPVASLAHDARVASHWFMAPMQLAQRVGPVALWIGFVAFLFAAPVLNIPGQAVGLIGLAWLVFCIYTWTAEAITRRFLVH